MDWHFRVHQRMTEAEKRGQHRSWYVDELVCNFLWPLYVLEAKFLPRIGFNPAKSKETKIPMQQTVLVDWALLVHQQAINPSYNI
jgi:hypothetical protein